LRFEFENTTLNQARSLLPSPDFTFFSTLIPVLS
jgi:hypothetical protein